MSFFLKALCCTALLELKNLIAKILGGKDLSKPQTCHQESSLKMTFGYEICLRVHFFLST